MILIALLAANIAAAVVGTSPATGLSVAVQGLRSASGRLVIALCTEREYRAEDCRRTLRVEPSVPSTVVRFTDPPPERFAIIAYHDRNANGRLDRGAFGVPSEGLGFSGDPFLLHKPDFSAISVTPDQQGPVAVTLHFEPGS